MRVPKIRPTDLRSTTRLLLAGGLLSTAVAGSRLLAQHSPAPMPWDAAFTPDAPALRKAADAIPPPEGKDFEVLLRDVSWTLDAAGRSRTRDRTVIRVLNEAGTEAWASIEQQWSPWYQQKPSIRARVIGKDGVAHELDPGTIAEGPAGDESDEIYSDRKVVRAPLPKISTGAIVEREIDTTEIATLLDAGAVHELRLVGPALHVRFAVSAPAALSLQWAVHAIAREAVEREEVDGTVRLFYQGGPFAPPEDWEIAMPLEALPAPLFSFSTGLSWHDVAARYAAIVDARIAAVGAGGLLSQAGSDPNAPPSEWAQLLTRLHRHVRYTGVEFGDAAIVPAPPSETWKRGYGDCKDKSVLLVALLRAAGARAHVALLDSGYGRDVNPSLPGLSRFNHAIVVIESPERIWIDATDPYSRPGQLPEGDQGRLALIASGETRELVRVPKSDAAANVTVETREFFLNEAGNSRLVVTQEPRGTRESSMRSIYHLHDRKDLQKSAEQRAATYYLGEKVEKLEYSDPTDLSKPFRVRFEVPESGRGQTDVNESGVAVLPEEWVGELWAFREVGDEETLAREKRKFDFVWREAFTDEWRYRIVAPDGYAPAALPESATRTVGPVVVSQEYKIENGREISATIRVSPSRERMTAAEFESARPEVKRLSEQKPFLIRFESVAARELAAGRTKEALDEYRRLIAHRPKGTVPRQRMALALLQAGLGESARRQARLAIENDPSSVAAYDTLAWILQHDLLGRRFGKGFDRAGAVAAYRKAVALEPKDSEVSGNLAILLEHDASGRRYGDRAQIREAIVEYQRMRNDLKVKTYDSNLAIALLRTDRFEEARSVAAEVPPGSQRNALLLAAIAGTDGADAAIREAGRLGESLEDRRAAIENAGRLLIVFRRYDLAATLLTEAAGRAEKPGELLTLAENLRRVRRFEDTPLPPDDPSTPVRKLYLAVLLHGAPGAPTLSSLVTSRVLSSGEDLEAEFLRGIRMAFASQAQAEGIPPEVLLDMFSLTTTIGKEGSDEFGYRLSMNSAGANNGLEVYVSREKGEWRIAGFGNSPELLGAEALARAEAGDLTGARQWLDWARSRMTGGGGDDPLGGPLLRRFWTRGDEGESRVRIAAAALVCSSPKLAARGKAILNDSAAVRESGAGAEDIELARAACASSTKNRAELDVLSAKLLGSHPDSDQAFGWRTQALVLLGRYDEAEKVCRDRLRRIADDPIALRALISTLLAHEDFAGVETASLELVEKGKASQLDYNNLAWNGLFTKITDRTVEWAQKGSGQPGSRSAAGLHTLAAIYAEMGRSLQAREALLESLRVRGAESPEPHDWYVLGRIAENYGEIETGREDYARVTPPKDDLVGGSTYELARRRLKLIGAATARPSLQQGARRARTGPETTSRLATSRIAF